MLEFQLIKQNKKARLGVLHTDHGDINTPAFMPVGTRGTVKSMLSEFMKKAGVDVILGNTYHLMLKPGADVIALFGGLHKFMNWDKPILTDSGGFQVMSLTNLRTISEEGVTFRSHIDGSTHIMTPETSTNIQEILNSDITMAFDECMSYPCSYDEAKNSSELTTRWAKRSRNTFNDRKGYGQFGIIQGSIYEDLRRKSTSDIVNLDFDGYAIGGLAVGEGQDLMFKVLDYTLELLPEKKPRYLMGVGKPSDIIGAVLRGVDMFDCVIPTRSGRNGQAFTKNGTINIRNAKYSIDMNPLEDDCECIACADYSRAYLHHVVKVGEIIGSILMTHHNIYYFQNLMKRIRKRIKNNEKIDFLM